MDRLTRKVKYEGETLYGSPNEIKCDDLEHLDKVYKKLGELEDKENELGCPLEVREKTLNSFYCPKFENDKKIYTYYVYAFNNEELFIRLIYNQYDEYYNEETTVLLKDYKKTWSINKEDLNIN